MSNTIPPYLKTGDTIGIVCPAGFMAAEKILPCVIHSNPGDSGLKSGKQLEEFPPIIFPERMKKDWRICRKCWMMKMLLQFYLDEEAMV